MLIVSIVIGGKGFLLFLVSLVSYYIECFLVSFVFKLLRARTNPVEALQTIQAMKTGKVEMGFSIVCYHFEDRYKLVQQNSNQHTHNNRNRHRHHEQRRSKPMYVKAGKKKVITYRASESFEFKECIDETPDFVCRKDVITRLHVLKVPKFADEMSAAEYKRRK
jgi:hypothetical protein